MARYGITLFVALILSGTPAAVQMCAPHCVTAVPCHESPVPEAQTAVKAGPQVCPHAAAIGALLGKIGLVPTKAIAKAPAHVGSPTPIAPPAEIATYVRLSAPHHLLDVRIRATAQLRI